MKQSLLLVLFATIGCSANSIVISEKASPERLRRTVEYLSDSIGGRSFVQPESLRRSIQYIEAQVREYGLEPRRQTYVVNGIEYSNVYWVIKGESETAFVVGAHFAEMLSQMKRNVAGMTSVEMIGYFTDEEKQTYPISLLKLFYPSRGNFVASVSNFSSSSLADEYQNNVELLNEINCSQLAAPASIPGVDFSDHLNFWTFGIHAFMITDTAFLRNTNYHEENDRSQYLDYKRMGFVINALANMTLGKF